MFSHTATATEKGCCGLFDRRSAAPAWTIGLTTFCCFIVMYMTAPAGVSLASLKQQNDRDSNHPLFYRVKSNVTRNDSTSATTTTTTGPDFAIFTSLMNPPELRVCDNKPYGMVPFECQHLDTHLLPAGAAAPTSALQCPGRGRDKDDEDDKTLLFWSQCRLITSDGFRVDKDTFYMPDTWKDKNDPAYHLFSNIIAAKYFEEDLLLLPGVWFTAALFTFFTVAVPLLVIVLVYLCRPPSMDLITLARPTLLLAFLPMSIVIVGTSAATVAAVVRLHRTAVDMMGVFAYSSPRIRGNEMFGDSMPGFVLDEILVTHAVLLGFYSLIIFVALLEIIIVKWFPTTSSATTTAPLPLTLPPPNGPDDFDENNNNFVNNLPVGIEPRSTSPTPSTSSAGTSVVVGIPLVHVAAATQQPPPPPPNYPRRDGERRSSHSHQHHHQHHRPAMNNNITMPGFTIPEQEWPHSMARGDNVPV